MKHNSAAFTLVEVLIAMGILTATLFIITNLQSRALYRILFDRDRIENFYGIKRDFLMSWETPPEEGKQKIDLREEGLRKIKYVTQTQEIKKDSSLKEFKKNIKILSSEVTWKDGRDERNLSMVSFVFQPPKKKDEKGSLLS